MGYSDPTRTNESLGEFLRLRSVGGLPVSAVGTVFTEVNRKCYRWRDADLHSVVWGSPFNDRSTSMG